ncbi:hypothetical protein [Sphingomonas oleivorans]|nr:hypothetical protein [Sphingomonas oleivorans]
MTVASPAAGKTLVADRKFDRKALAAVILPQRQAIAPSAARYRTSVADLPQGEVDSAWRLEWARKGALAKLARPIGYKELAEFYYRLPLGERITLQPGIRHIRQRAGLRGENDGRTVFGLGANFRLGR